MLRLLAVALLAPVLSPGPPPTPSPAPSAVPPAELAGAWAGTASHEGETTPVAIELEPGSDDKVLIKLSAPVVHLRHAPLGRATPQAQGREIKLGPFVFAYDPAARTLTGDVPEGLAPVYKLPMTLQRVERLDLPARPEPVVAERRAVVVLRRPGPPLARHVLRRWSRVRRRGGRTDACARRDHGEGALVVPRRRSDPDASGGVGRRRCTSRPTTASCTRSTRPAARSAGACASRTSPSCAFHPGDPTSRFDRFGSDVTVAGGRLYLGTHDGRVLCLEAAQGRQVWQFASGDSVLAAPAVDGGRVYFGSYDGSVYALDAATGRPLWKHDTGKPVVSTPALAGDRVVVGSRSYDLLGLDARTGAVAWKRYIWFSWVESSPVVRDGIAYVGSSDAAALYAFDARSGRPVWKTDVWGWAWGQPAVTDRRVYIGTSALGGYLVGHRAGIMAVDRATGSAGLAPHRAAGGGEGLRLHGVGGGGSGPGLRGRPRRPGLRVRGVTTAAWRARGRPAPRRARPPCRGRERARSARRGPAPRAGSCARATLPMNQSRNSRRRLHHPAAHEVGAGVGEVGGDGEQAADGHGLLLEDAPRHAGRPSRRTTRTSFAACASDPRRPSSCSGKRVSQ